MLAGRAWRPRSACRGALAETGAAREQALIGEVLEGFSQHGRRVDEDLLQRVHGGGPRLDGGIPRDFELTHHLDGAVCGLGCRGRLAREHRPCGGLGVDAIGLAGDAPQAPVRSIHFDDTMPRAADGPREAHAIAAGAFDAKRVDPPVCLSPREQRPIAARIGGERVRTLMDPTGVDRTATWTCLWVSTPMIVRRASGCRVMRLVTGASSGCRHAWTGWTDRTVTGRRWQAPIGSTAHPVSWLPYESPAGDDRQINSEDRGSVKLRVRPPLTGTHRRHQVTPTGSGIMLTVKLKRSRASDPQDSGADPSCEPACWASPPA